MATTDVTQPLPRAASILMIGYGNSLRGDDGLGPYVVSQLAKRDLPRVRTKIVFQLTPELAEEVAASDIVIFVDARMNAPETVAVAAVRATPRAEGITHQVSAATLLGLAKSMYGSAPRAWVVSVGGIDFAVREGLSQHAQANADRAIAAVATLVTQGVNDDAPPYGRTRP